MTASKVVCFLLSLTLLLSCVACDNGSAKFTTTEYDIKDSVFENCQTELLRAQDGKLYFNDLNTEENPFLFTTKALTIVSNEGSLEKQIVVTTGKRITDFIYKNGKIYYFTLFESTGQFIAQLCTMDEKTEKLSIDNVTEEYIIDDPYAYPRFIKYGDRDCYKINRSLYFLGDSSPLLTAESDIFLSKPAKSVEQFCYKISEKQGYTVMKEDKMLFEGELGNFALTDKYFVYQNENGLVLRSLDTEIDEELSISGGVFDFAVLGDDILVISTENKVLSYDIEGKKMLDEVKRPLSSVGWLFCDGDAAVYMYSSDAFYKYTVTE